MSAIRAAMAVLAVLFGGGFVILVLVALRAGLRQRARREWKRAPAVVTSVGWESRPDALGVLRVVFEVEGHSSSVLDVGEAEQREDQREELLGRFAEGTSHEALVDPSGASPAVMVTGLIAAPLVPLFIGVVFLAVGGVMAWLAWYFGQPDNLLSRVLGN